MAHQILRQLTTIVRGCIRGGDHARALRLIITNLPRTEGHPNLLRLLAQVFQEMGREAQAREVLDLLIRHLTHRGQPLLAVACALQLSKMQRDIGAHLDYIASLYGASSPFLDAYDPGPKPPADEQVAELDLSGTHPAEPLEALAELALARAVERLSTHTSPDLLPPIPLLSHLEPEPLQQVLAALRLDQWLDGTTLLSPTDPPRGAHWIVSGTLSARDPQGRVRALGAGTLVGHQTLLGRPLAPASFLLQTQTRAESLTLDPHALPEAIKRQELLPLVQRFDDACLLARAFRSSAIFSQLSAQELEPLYEVLEACQISPDTAIIHQGQGSDGLYLVVEGRFEVRKRDGDAYTTVHTAGPGELLGEISLVTDGDAVASVVSVGQGRVIFVDKAHIERLCDAHPHLLNDLRSVAVQRLLEGIS